MGSLRRVSPAVVLGILGAAALNLGAQPAPAAAPDAGWVALGGSGDEILKLATSDASLLLCDNDVNIEVLIEEADLSLDPAVPSDVAGWTQYEPTPLKRLGGCAARFGLPGKLRIRLDLSRLLAARDPLALDDLLMHELGHAEASRAGFDSVLTPAMHEQWAGDFMNSYRQRTGR